jgi:hypothetical protein
MLNFYRRFLPNSAATQTPMHDVLSDSRIKGSHPIAWTPELLKALRGQGEFVTHQSTGEPRSSRVTCTRHRCLHVRHGWRATATLQEYLAASRLQKLNPARQKYGACDREQLAIYEAIKYFRHMLEAPHAIIFTDHSPLPMPSSRSGTNPHRGSSIF